MKNKSQKLYQDLKMEILKKMKDGDKISSLRQLVIKYDLNINTIIKVIKRLENEGYLYSEKGRGYFVNGVGKVSISPEKIQIMKNYHSSQKREEEINFVNGSPNIEKYLYIMYEEIAVKMLKNYKSDLLNYQEIQGLESLREVLAEELEKNDIFTTSENIVITSGTQSSLLIILKLFLEINKKVVGMSFPDYPNVFNLIKNIMKIKEIYDLENDGWNLTKFEKEIKKEKIDLLYLVPNFHNPTGITWSDKKKEKIVELAEKYDFYIIEDDCFSDFYYTKRVRSMKSYDKIGKERVIYIKTYSKILMPDLSLAMMVLPSQLIKKALEIKYCVDHSVSGLRQSMLECLIKSGYLDCHLKNLKKRMKRKYKEMYLLLNMIQDIKIVNKTKGGFFIWIKLPDYIDEELFCLECKKNKVNLLPGKLFYLDGKKRNYVRLSFATVSLERIREGVEIIKKILKNYKEKRKNEF